MATKKSVHEKAAEDTQALRDQILLEALLHVPFDGWSKRAMAAAEVSSGLGEGVAYRAFPGGLSDMAIHASDYFDRQMLARLEDLDLEDMLELWTPIAFLFIYSICNLLFSKIVSSIARSFS